MGRHGPTVERRARRHDWDGRIGIGGFDVDPNAAVIAARLAENRQPAVTSDRFTARGGSKAGWSRHLGIVGDLSNSPR